MAQKEFVDFEVEGLDLSNTKPMEGGAFALVDEGTYKVEVVAVSQEENKNNKPYIEVEFLITEGQETDEAAKFIGQHLWGNYYLTDKAKGRIVQLMQACGAPLDKFRASAIFGAQIVIDVVHNQGDATTDSEGNVQAARTFANVCRERALEGTAQAQAPTPPPPAAKVVSKPGASKPAGNSAQARRA